VLILYLASRSISREVIYRSYWGEIIKTRRDRGSLHFGDVMRKKVTRILLILVSILIPLALFQNCGPAKVSSDHYSETASSVSPYVESPPPPISTATPVATPPSPTPTPSVSMLKTNGEYCLARSQQADSSGGLELIQAPCINDTSQYFIKGDTGTANVFSLTSAASGECINVPGASTTAGTKVNFWQCYSVAWMQWIFSDNGNGTFRLIDNNSKNCLTYNAYSVTTDQQLYISTCDAADPRQSFHY